MDHYVCVLLPSAMWNARSVQMCVETICCPLVSVTERIETLNTTVADGACPLINGVT